MELCKKVHISIGHFNLILQKNSSNQLSNIHKKYHILLRIPIKIAGNTDGTISGDPKEHLVVKLLEISPQVLFVDYAK